MTKTNLAKKVLEKMGIVSPGQTPQSGDQTSVEDAYDSLYQWLRGNHYVSWGSAEDIPTWAVLPTTEVLAMRMGPDFGRPGGDWEGYAHRQFSSLTRNDWDGEPITAEYF